MPSKHRVSSLPLRVAVLLLACFLIIACGLPFGSSALPKPPGDTPQGSNPTLPQATRVPSATPVLATKINLPTSTAAALATATVFTPSQTASAPWVLAVSQAYQLPIDKGVLGASLGAGDGKIWVGSLQGSILPFDPQSGTFGQIVPTGMGNAPGGPQSPNLNPVLQMSFTGQYLWALVDLPDQKGEEHAHMLSIDPGGETIVHQWDISLPDWQKDTAFQTLNITGFGVSPGKIWIDYHVIDTQTFAVTAKIPMPEDAVFAYDNSGYMWMTGRTGGDCDGDLLFTGVDDPAHSDCEKPWPFLPHVKDGYTGGVESLLTLAGDRMWISGGTVAPSPITSVLEAYSADHQQLLQEKAPLARVTLPDNFLDLKMVYAGNSLWLVNTHGEHKGLLYQLDAKTGASINTLDLAQTTRGYPGNDPHDIATDGHNLWILTTFQLLQIKLP